MSVDVVKPGRGEQAIEFRDEDFQWFRQTASEHSGILLPDSKKNMVYSRLTRRLRALRLDSFLAYRKVLSGGDAREFGEFINTLTTNLTAFFREAHHFDHLRAVAVPDLVARHGADTPLRIWSSACSTGEEPYSIAMTMEEACRTSRTRFSILATDLDTQVLAQASAGVYTNDGLEPIATELRRRYLQRGADEFDGRFRVRDEVRAQITFRQLNLTTDWRHDSPQHVIFCRNVVIYFDKPLQRRLFDRMADQLVPGGYLYIGHAETLFQVSDRFQACGQTIYRRVR